MSSVNFDWVSLFLGFYVQLMILLAIAIHIKLEDNKKRFYDKGFLA